MNALFGKYALAAAVAGGVGMMASNVEAGSMVLGNSGWKASWDASFDDASASFVSLTVLAETGDAVVLQKAAAFTSGVNEYGFLAPIEINFEQVSANAAKKIVITSESVWNATGADWNGFKFIIEDGSTGDASKDVHFNMYDTYGDSNPFNTSPFMSHSASGSAGLPQTLTFGDGIVTDGSIWHPGVGTNPDAGEVVINANPSANGTTRFVFKEQPLPIPLPAAAWMGLSSLGALGLAGGLKRVRRTIA